jgi:hypothetical protein
VPRGVLKTGAIESIRESLYMKSPNTSDCSSVNY